MGIKTFKISLMILTFLLAIPLSSQAEETATKHPKWSLAAGPVLGYDINTLTSAGGGVGFELGYELISNLDILLRTGVYYTKDKGTNYFGFPHEISVRLMLIKKFFIHAGAGYHMIAAEQGTHFGSSRTSLAKLYNGFGGYAALGYSHNISQKFSIKPEAGLRYSRVAGINRLNPQAVVMFQYRFGN